MCVNVQCCKDSQQLNYVLFYSTAKFDNSRQSLYLYIDEADVPMSLSLVDRDQEATNKFSPLRWFNFCWITIFMASLGNMVFSITRNVNRGNSANTAVKAMIR